MEATTFQVVNSDGTTSNRRRKTCTYNGIEYLVQKDKKKKKKYLYENGECVLDENGKKIWIEYYPRFIEVDGNKLYLDKNGNISNKQPGRYSTVDFLTLEEISMMKSAFNKKIEDAKTPTNKLIAWRNYTLFGCGINVGLRASDLRKLRWNDVYNKDGSRKSGWKFESQKTGKKTVITYNDAFFEYLENYKEKIYDLKDKPLANDYIFFSKKKDSEPIEPTVMWDIMNEASTMAGIDTYKNIGSHSLRKTFGRQVYDAAKDKTAVLVQLQRWFRHSSTTTTLTYIGITQEEDYDMVQSIHL